MMPIIIAAKLLTETASAAATLTVWLHVHESGLLGGPLTSRAAAWYVVVLGAIVTGYLSFVVGLGALCAFLSSLRARAGIVPTYLPCLAFAAYVGVALLLTRINHFTVPIALGLVAGNALFLASYIAPARA